MPNGASVQAVTVFAEAPVLGQPGTVAGKATGPWTRFATVTIAVISGARPTAPFQVNGGDVLPVVIPTPGEEPLVAPSVVAGSPRTSVPGNGTLNTYGNWVPGWPAATSVRPESGPNENRYV